MIKFIICQYKPGQTEPPYLHDEIGSFEIAKEKFEDKTDTYGERRAGMLRAKMQELGHSFHFYTIGDRPGEYNVFARVTQPVISDGDAEAFDTD